mgnify:CR=1 FL=1
MSDLVLHRGGQLVQKADLDLVQLPPQTDSYIPVSHFHLADKLLTISRDMLTDYALVGENYALARQGNQLFALLNFKRDHGEIGLSVAFRNSYDRSMSIGLAIGGNVFICDNLALSGEVAVMKKHTKNVLTALEDLAISTLYRANHNYQRIVADATLLRNRELTDKQAFMLFGLLYGQNVLSPRQFTTAVNEWQKPRHEAFQARNMWSLYNCATEALKTAPPTSIMEAHSKLHDVITLEADQYRVL